jgi:cytochrome P450
MSVPGTKPKISVLDPMTYGNGDPTTFGLPLDQFTYLRESEPCYLQEFDQPYLMDRAWIVSRHEDIVAIDRDIETWTAGRGWFNCAYGKLVFNDPINNPEFGVPSILTCEAPDHRRHRKVVSSSFTPTAASALEERFRGYAREVVDHALELGTFNFVTEVAHLMPMQALGDVLGVPEEDRPRFFGWVDQFAAPFDDRITKSLDQVLQANLEMLDYALELRENRQGDPPEEVLTRMVRATVDETLSNEEYQGDFVTMAAGAAESTRAALSHGLHELMRCPDQMQWLRDHADDIPASAIQEMVRISTPFIHFNRVATRDAEIAGQEVKEGEIVALLFCSGNFDPEAIEDPTRFDLSRDPNPHVSFGRGPHACLGKHVAALEMKVLLEELLQRTKEIQPAGEISYVRDAFARGVYQLPVTVTT